MHLSLIFPRLTPLSNACSYVYAGAPRRHLDAGHRLSYADITARLGITERQARRLIQVLRAGGVPIREEQDGRTKRFFLAPEHRRERATPLDLTPEEALALSVAVRAGAAVLKSTPLRSPLASAARQLVGHLTDHTDLFDLDEQEERWYFDAVALNRIDPGVFGVVLQALERQQSVRIDYQKPSGPLDEGRKVDPHCFAVVGNAVMVAAYCHRRRAMRDFALPRIRQAVLCDPAADPKPYFTRRADFDPRRYFDRFGAMAGGQVHVMRLLVEPDRVPFFEDRDYHPSQDLEHVDEEGRAQVSFEAIGFEEMRSFAQSWGVGVTVLEPAELTAQVLREAETLVARYAAADAGHGMSGDAPPSSNLAAD